MGTRNIIGVRLNNQWRVAQYAQWDGYPAGQGMDVLNFCRSTDLKVFREKVEKCFFFTNEQLKEIYAPYSIDGWMSYPSSMAFNVTDYAYLSRDTGAKILSIIMNSDTPLGLKDSHDFLRDGLFCEWAWVLDLDRNKLQAYGGFNKTPENNPLSITYGLEPKGETYANGDIYYPARLLAEWPLDNLPTDEDFLALNKYGEDDEAYYS